jgi:F0F1-type ATP synthase membrane subunit b/b'
MNKTFRITVDTQKSVQNPSFHVNTNDLRTIQLLISVQSNGKPVNLEDAQVRIAVLKPDKKTVFQDVVVVDAASGLCEVIMDSQAYVVPGEHTAELMIYFVGERVSVTGRFNYRAISGILSDETVESQNEYQAINKLVLDAETAAQNAKQAETNAKESELVAKQAETNAVNAAANTLDELEERTEQFYEQKAAELRAPIDDLSAQLAQSVRGLQPRPLQNISVSPVESDTVIPTTTFGGFLWGRVAQNLYRSEDAGKTWIEWGRIPESFNTMIPTFDNEVVATGGNGLYKSEGFWTGNPTWVKKVTPNGAAQFHGWSLAGNGEKFMTTEYAAGSNFPDSRYVRRSLDGGNTWDIVYDSVEVHGKELADSSHLHGIAYDKWADRWYFSEGHGSIAGIYVSEDDGETWQRAEGMAIMDPSPTVIVPTDDGLVCASDHPNGGLYGVVRRSDPMKEELVQTVAWRPAADGTNGFGIYGVRDEKTGIVFIGYRTEKNVAAPVLLAGTTTTGEIVYEWDGDFIAYDDIRNIVIPKPNHIWFVVSTQGHTKSYIVKAEIPNPGTKHVSLEDTGRSLGGTASKATSVALGVGSSTGDSVRSVSLGINAETLGTQDNIAIGYQANTNGSHSIAIGTSSKSESNAVVIGDKAQALSSTVVAIGNSSSATGSGVAIGYNTHAKTASVVIGNQSKLETGSNATVVGYDSRVWNEGVSLGYKNTHDGNNGTSVGARTTVTSNATAIGNNASALHYNSVAIGKDTSTNLPDQVAVGSRHLMGLALQSVPINPPQGSGILYFKENEEGKLALYVRFPSGLPIEIAVEP